MQTSHRLQYPARYNRGRLSVRRVLPTKPDYFKYISLFVLIHQLVHSHLNVIYSVVIGPFKIGKQ